MSKAMIKNRIESALKGLQIKNNKGIYSLGELETIARTAGVEMIYVMKYLRFGRV